MPPEFIRVLLGHHGEGLIGHLLLQAPSHQCLRTCVAFANAASEGLL